MLAYPRHHILVILSISCVYLLDIPKHIALFYVGMLSLITLPKPRITELRKGVPGGACAVRICRGDGANERSCWRRSNDVRRTKITITSCLMQSRCLFSTLHSKHATGHYTVVTDTCQCFVLSVCLSVSLSLFLSVCLFHISFQIHVCEIGTRRVTVF